MSTTTTYRIDIDGTIADPLFFDDDVHTCCGWYCNANIVKQEEVTALTLHQHLYLLPQVLITHKPMDGSIAVLSRLVEQGKSLQYFTVRQAIEPAICRLVYGNTHVWLETTGFPCPSAVSFFWDAGEKLVKSLDAPEDRIIVIDDRPSGLAKAYGAILEKDPDRAQQIRERVVLLAFGITDPCMLPDIAGFRVVPLPSWVDFERVSAEVEKEFSYGIVH